MAKIVGMVKIVGVAKITCVAKIIAAAKIIRMAQMKMALTRCSRSTRQRIINKSDGTAKTRLREFCWDRGSKIVNQDH